MDNEESNKKYIIEEDKPLNKYYHVHFHSIRNIFKNLFNKNLPVLSGCIRKADTIPSVK